MDSEKQLKKVEKLFEMISEEYAKPEEVAQLFEAVFGLIKDIKTQLEQNIAENKGEMDSKHNGLYGSMCDMEERMKGICSKISDKQVGDKVILEQQIIKEVNKIKDLIPEEADFTEIEQKITEVEKKIPEIKDITPYEVRNKLESIDIESEKLDILAIKDLRKELDALKKTIKNAKGITIFGGGGNGGGKTVKAYDLSSQLNGVLKTFSLPAFWRIISVHSSSFPVAFRPIVDYTTNASNMTITFTSEISVDGALATGQTLIVIYAE